MIDVPDLPLLTHKDYASPSAFTPEALLREARRQKALPESAVPGVCVLDPDGDIVRWLTAEGRGQVDATWACYHTTLVRARIDEIELGVVGCAVGAPFAVLVAEELFAAGCALLVSVTSCGQLVALRSPPYFVLIESAVRDEGTSHHYLPPAERSHADPALLAGLRGQFGDLPVPVETGATWTTDAPFRETQVAIDAMTARGLSGVEMEAAALYAFAAARQKRVVCFAHVTNQMGRVEGDFEKGEAAGAVDALRIIVRTARALMPR